MTWKAPSPQLGESNTRVRIATKIIVELHFPELKKPSDSHQTTKILAGTKPRMTVISYWLLLLCGIWLMGVGIFIFVRPTSALDCLKKMASTNLINYTEISLRMLAGLAFLQYAGASQHPQGIYVCGWFLVVTSGILFLIPRKWHAAYAVYWSQRLSPPILKFCSPISIGFGALLIFAIN